VLEHMVKFTPELLQDRIAFSLRHDYWPAARAE
jgi:hypothetical protein